MNQTSFNLQKELSRKSPWVSQCMDNLPANLIWHVYKRLQQVDPSNMQVTQLQPGEFNLKFPGQSKLSVQTLMNDSSSMYKVTLEDDEREHTVVFGDSSTYPSCQCQEWNLTRLPCIHFVSVFKLYPSWSFDMMSPAYRYHAALNLDWAFIKESDSSVPIPAVSFDSSTQTEYLGCRKTVGRLRSKEINEKMVMLSTAQCQHFIKLLLKINLLNFDSGTLTSLKKKLISIVSFFLPMVNVDKLCELCPIQTKALTPKNSGDEAQQHSRQQEVQNTLQVLSSKGLVDEDLTRKGLRYHCLELLYLIEKFQFTSYSHHKLVILKGELKSTLLQLLSDSTAHSLSPDELLRYPVQTLKTVNSSTSEANAIHFLPSDVLSNETNTTSRQTDGMHASLAPSLNVVPTGMVLHYANSEKSLYVPILPKENFSKNPIHAVGGSSVKIHRPIARKAPSTLSNFLPQIPEKRRKGRKRIEKPSAAEVIEKQLSHRGDICVVSKASEMNSDVENIHVEVTSFLREC